MKVGILGGSLPYPANSGARIRTLNLAIRLANRHDIRFLANYNPDRGEAKQGLMYLKDHGIEVIEVDYKVPSKRGVQFPLRLAANLVSPLPYSIASHASFAMEQTVRSISQHESIDLWQAEWLGAMLPLRTLPRHQKLLMAPNVETLIWERYAINASGKLKRAYIRNQARKFANFERLALQKAERVVTVSENDAALVRDRFAMQRVDVVDNGIDRGFFETVKPNRDPRRILFLGSLDWHPNIDAIQMLLDTIYPKIVAEVPAVTLDIVGRNPSDSLVRRIREQPGVRLHANVDDVRPFLASSGLMVVPLQIGGGSRLKILEALATGLPVISTEIGAEGLQLLPDVHISIANEPRNLSQRLIDAVREPDRFLDMAKQGRRFVLERYDWDHLAEALEKSWEACMSAHPLSFSLI